MADYEAGKVIYSQIPLLAKWDWGAKDAVLIDKGVRFKPSGYVQWKGYIEITLDYGLDLYDIKFFRVRKVKNTFEYKTIVDKEIHGVYADQMVEIIDRQVLKK